MNRQVPDVPDAAEPIGSAEGTGAGMADIMMHAHQLNGAVVHVAEVVEILKFVPKVSQFSAESQDGVCAPVEFIFRHRAVVEGLHAVMAANAI